MKFIVHIGANKTGSTLIQNHILPKINNHLAMTHVYRSEAIANQVGIHIQRPEPLQYMSLENIAKSKKIIAQELSKIIKKDPSTKSVILTREKYFGNPRASTAFDNIEIIASDIKNMLAGHDVKIVAYVRRQDTYLESNYNTSIKMGDSKTFSEFLDSIDPYGYKWDELLDKYVKHFGKFNVFVFPYEDLLGDKNKFYANFMSVVGVPLINVDLPVVNPGLSNLGTEIMRASNKCFSGNNIKKNPKRVALRKFLEENFKKDPAVDFGLFSDEERNNLLNRYRHSNERLFSEFIGGYKNMYGEV